MAFFAQPDEFLRQAYAAQQALWNAQPPLVQRFLEVQARQLAEAVMQRQPIAVVTLPDRVAISPEAHDVLPVPTEARQQTLGGWLDRLTRANPAELLRLKLAELDGAPNRAVAASSGLVRYAVAAHMVYQMLPAGRTVHYLPAADEEIPTIPADEGDKAESAITEATDAIAEEGKAEAGRGELQVPYTPAARRFYLPQWVAFDDQDNLLVNTLSEAEAHIISMQNFVAVLHAAVALAPYVVAAEDYQRKRYGMLGQLINQGRALARFKTGEIVATIKRRAAANDLNRGLSVSLPYFDDQVLRMEMRLVPVIPAGRIMFVPAFVVRAAREEQAKVAQDTRLSPSTRKHLLAELRTLEQAFS